MSATRTYYQLLGVSGNANFKSIKRAFYKLALQYHPDRNIDEDKDAMREKFSEILKAYEVLKDPQKRNIYDKYGERGLANQGMMPNVDDLWDMVFSETANQQRTDPSSSAEDILAQIKVNATLSELYRGTVKYISFDYTKRCSMCCGKGNIVTTHGAICNTCNGSGRAARWGRAKCNHCQGSGQSTQNAKIKCDNCRGRGTFVGKVKDKQISIAAGLRHRDVITIEHNDYDSGINGSVLIEIHCQKDPKYKVKRSDLFRIEPVPITLRSALCGGDFVVQHFGEKLYVQCDYNMIETNTLFKIAGYGMLQGSRGTLRGDLYVKFSVVMPDPKALNPRMIKQICNVLPKNEPCAQNARKVQIQLLDEWDQLGFEEETNNDSSNSNGNAGNEANEAPPDCKQM